MKWKMLITALLIGSAGMTSVAAAQPSNGPEVYERHRRPGDYDRDRYDRDRYPQDYDDYSWDSSQGWIPPVLPSGGSYEANGYGYDDRGWRPLIGPIANYP